MFTVRILPSTLRLIARAINSTGDLKVFRLRYRSLKQVGFCAERTGGPGDWHPQWFPDMLLYKGCWSLYSGRACDTGCLRSSRRDWSLCSGAPGLRILNWVALAAIRGHL
jgi:hypothetical protein